MDISYGSKKLQKCAEDQKYGIQKLGVTQSKLYWKRLGDLEAAETLEDVRSLPGHFHELRENRKGQWACDLDQPNRLIFVPHEDPIPEDKDGKYIWLEIKGIQVVEIEDYHKRH